MGSRWRWIFAQITESLSVILVLGGLGIVAYLGQRNDWKLPSWITGSTPVESGVAREDSPTEETAEPLPIDPVVSGDSHLSIRLERIKLKSPAAASQAGIQLGRVKQQPIEQQVLANGVLEYNQNRYANLSPRVPGNIWRVDILLGDFVRQGDVLAIVEAPEVGKAKSEFLQSVIQVSVRTSLLNQLRESSRSISDIMLRNAQTALREANIKLMTDVQALNNLGLPVRLDSFQGLTDDEMARVIRVLGLPASVLKGVDTTTLTANLLPIRAPFDGEVVIRNASLGEQVSPSTPLFGIANLSRLWVLLDIRREDARLVKVGQHIQFGPDSSSEKEAMNNHRAQGQIFWISPEVDPKTRTIKVRAEVNNPVLTSSPNGMMAAATLALQNDPLLALGCSSYYLSLPGRLRPNTYGIGRIMVGSDQEALVVPNEAIQSEGDQQFVFVHLSDQEFEPRLVKLGVRNEKVTEVLGGLKLDEIVATQGSFVLKTELLKERLGGGE